MLDLRRDLALLDTLRRAILPLPLLDTEQAFDAELFPPLRVRPIPALAGRRIGLVATGGSGAMACALGVVRAMEEAGLQVAAISACAASALFLAPISAGLSAQEAVDFVLGWRLRDYFDPQWRRLLRVPLSLGRGFGGLVKAEAIERLFHQRLGGVTLDQLPIPLYTSIWDLEQNHLFHPGTGTQPHMRLARLVRAAVTLPLVMQPLELDGVLCASGGLIDSFPVQPLIEQHPEIDFFIGINGLYPENFAGEDLGDWLGESWSILRLGFRSRTNAQVERARRQLSLIQDRCLMLHPLPRQENHGLQFYELFLNRTRWPEFIVRGYYYTRRLLQSLDGRPGMNPAPGQESRELSDPRALRSSVPPLTEAISP